MDDNIKTNIKKQIVMILRTRYIENLEVKNKQILKYFIFYSLEKMSAVSL